MAVCQVLFVSACPTGQKVLSTDREWRAIRRARRDSKYGDQIGVEYSSAVTWSDFCAELLDIEPDVVHVSVHADPTHLLFELEGTYREDRQSIEKVVTTLDEGAYRPKLLLFMSCDGHELGVLCKDLFAATITSAGRLNDLVALRFVDTFYRVLLKGGTVKWSFDNARPDISPDGPEMELHSHEPGQIILVGRESLDGGPQQPPAPAEQEISRLHATRPAGGPAPPFALPEQEILRLPSTRPGERRP